MKGTMSMEWSEVFSEETCNQCNGSGVGEVNYNYNYMIEDMQPCDRCHGVGKKVNKKKYDLYMDEYNYRMGLD